MKKRSEPPQDWQASREKMIGLGEKSIRKSYYPELQQRLADLEAVTAQLEKANRELQTEIAERKLSEEALVESEAFIKAVMDNLPIGVAVTSVKPSSRFVYMNDQFPLHYRTSKDKLINPERFWDVVFEDPEYRREIRRRMEVDCAGGDQERMHWVEVPITRQGAETSYVTAKNVWVPAKQQIISIVWDVTEQKKAREEQEDLSAQLHQARKLEAVGRLAGGVAHDFNNMLSIIVGYAEMLLDKISSDNPFYRGLSAIKNAADRSADLTYQLLAFARKQTTNPKVLDLNETALEFLKMLRRLIGEDIDLGWFPGLDLWPVRIDPGQVGQVLANLAVNARDAIDGVGRLTVETANVTFDKTYCQTHEGFTPGRYVLLAVSDTGVGMKKETLDHIFEPFFTTKEMGKGTGLGLATVYGIVKQNNGFINVYSEPGHGTTFKIYLPRAERPAAALSAPHSPADLNGTETILFVEDEEAILSLGKTILELHGYKVLAANTPRGALEIARNYRGPIHLLITDVVMPEMNGKDLRDELYTARPGFKCIFISGYTANVIARHGVLNAGIDFLQKPFSVQSLAAKVREVLHS